MGNERDNNRAHMHMLSINILKLIEIEPLIARYTLLQSLVVSASSIAAAELIIEEYRMLEPFITNVHIARGLGIGDEWKDPAPIVQGISQDDWNDAVLHAQEIYADYALIPNGDLARRLIMQAIDGYNGGVRTEELYNRLQGAR